MGPLAHPRVLLESRGTGAMHKYTKDPNKIIHKLKHQNQGQIKLSPLEAPTLPSLGTLGVFLINKIFNIKIDILTQN